MNISLTQEGKPFIFRLTILIFIFICLILSIILINTDFKETITDADESVNKEEFFSEPINNVYFGRDGWLYYIESIADYQRTNLFSEEELEKIKSNLQEVQAFLAEKDIAFYLIIAPNKNTIYPEFMPTNVIRNESISRLEQIYNYIEENTDIKIIKVRDQLISEKENSQLYYKTDTHWNQEGARIASNELLKAINADLPQVPKLNLDIFNKTLRDSKMKDLAYMLERADEYKEEEYIYTPKINTIDVLRTNEPSDSFGVGVFNEMNDRGDTYQLSHYIKLRNASVKDGLRLYMIRDSFTVNMIPFINEAFYQCTYVWTSKFEKKAILEEEPDVVVYEVVERYLQNLLWMLD
ncbi:MAG: hypothetical protein K0S55_1275 [Clostridia bacterium]|nr:hypothetical protein [Clostridia bacterium]